MSSSTQAMVPTQASSPLAGTPGRRSNVSLRTAALELRGSFVFQSLDQLTASITDSVRAGPLTLEDFDRALEFVRSTPDLATPSTACASPLIRHRGRSYSSGKVAVNLTLDDLLCSTQSDLPPLLTPTGVTPIPPALLGARRRSAGALMPEPPGMSGRRGRAALTGPAAWLRLEDVALGDVIGKGAMGTVYRGMVKSSGEQIAVKVVTVDKDDPGSASHLEALDNELTILQELDHPRIVRYLGHERVPQKTGEPGEEKLVIFCEYLPGGSIAGALRQFGPFEEDQIASNVRQMLEGLKYLHENRVVHRDIKSANALMDLQGNVHLADFGCSKKLDVTSTMAVAAGNPTGAGGVGLAKTLKGSVPWMAPEVILGDGHGRPADIWALGCCVIEMATGKHPWAGKLDNVLQAMYRIAMLEENLEVPEKLSAACQDFVLKCTKRDPKLRPTAAELLNHPWLLRVAASRRASLAPEL